MPLTDLQCPSGHLLHQSMRGGVPYCARCSWALGDPFVITWRIGDRCRVRGRPGTIKALSQTTPCVTSVDVLLDRDPETGHVGWICTSVDELEPA